MSPKKVLPEQGIVVEFNILEQGNEPEPALPEQGIVV